MFCWYVGFLFVCVVDVDECGLCVGWCCVVGCVVLVFVDDCVVGWCWCVCGVCCCVV